MSKKPALGFFINDNSLEVLELGSSSGKYYISGYGWSRLPSGIITNGKVKDSQVLAEEMKKVMASARPRPLQGPLVLGLPQSQTFLKVFTVPEFEGRDLEEAINWYIDSLSPVIPEDSYTSYEILGKNENNELQVLLTASQKSVIDAYIEACVQAGVEIAVIEPTVIAKARLISHEQLLKKSVVVFHLYGGILTASVLLNSKVWFSRESFVTQDNEQEIKVAVTEIVDYFVKRKEKEIPALTELLYCGDQAGFQILAKSLSNNGWPLKIIKAEPGIVLGSSQIVSDVETAVFVPVLGLALRGRLEQKGIINLLPAWPSQQTRVASLGRTFSLWLVMVIVLVWLTGILLSVFWWWLGQEYKRVAVNQGNIKIDQKQEDELFSWRNQFNDMIKGAKMISSSQTDYDQALSQLAVLTPKAIRITAFSWRPLAKEWSITGMAEKREDVLVFDRELKNSTIFTDAQLFFSSLDTESQVIFRFTGGSRED